MTPTFFDNLRPFITKILAPLVGAFFAWLATKYGIIIDEQTQAEFVFAVAAVITGIVSVIVNKVINPANAASATLAVQSRVETVEQKREERVEKELKKAGLDEIPRGD